jgi:dienelactone hydrolase
MLGIVLFIFMSIIEIGFMSYCLMTKAYQKDKRHLVRLSVFGLLLLLAITGVIRFSFRYYMLYLILFVNAISGAWYFWKKKDKKQKLYKKKYVIISGMGRMMLLTTAIFPAVMFPQFKPIAVSGDLKVTTVSYTLTDPDRRETFSDKEENRKVTVQFWYPKDGDEKCPLVVFSHGAFGFRGSNTSTFENLASNGYVVCSIDHTYHSFFTKQTDGKLVLANMGFINDAMAAQNDDYDDQKTFELSQEWLNLRVGDMNFVLEDTLAKAGKQGEDDVYQRIDPERIGVFGHSLGGATSAQIGRERSDIDAVIVVDGTMFGEEIGYENGEYRFNDQPYPVPLLNIYNEEHYEEAMQLGESYDNIRAASHAADAREVMFRGAGHLNFTDLPMFSPILAGMLGTGDIDSRYCIETMNSIILNYFNYYLKDAAGLDLQAEY